MHILEETDEFLFIQHAIGLLDTPNQRPDLEPGGLWVKGIVRISWGLRMVTEPPTIQVGRSSGILNGPSPLPRDLEGRLGVWRAVWRNREHSSDLANLDFRDVVTISAILGWNQAEELTSDEPTIPHHP